jgi:zinc/manganese transport system substrate-binding protein
MLKSFTKVVAITLLLTTGIRVTAQSESLKVVASFSILADVVQQVAGDTIEVTSLIPADIDPHSFLPSPRDITAIAEADVVFINGANFEELLLEAITNAGSTANMVVASNCIPILSTGAAGHHHDEENTDHKEEDEHNQETVEANHAGIAERCLTHETEIHVLTDEDNHSKVEALGALYSVACGHHEDESEPETDVDHEHGNCDPHVWTDPQNVIYWTLMIRDTLIELDPANADIYTVNAAAYSTALHELTHDFIEPMLNSVPEANRILVTNHETLGYLAVAYGYELVGTVIPGANTASEPSAADVAALIDLIKEEKVTAVFAENTVNTRIAEQVAAESGAQFYTLLSDSLTADATATTYIDYMRYNVTTIVEALGGQVSQ